MADYILIDATTRAPVPLPYHTTLVSGHPGLPVVIYSFEEPSSNDPGGYLVTNFGKWFPGRCGLNLITEAEFMAERDQ